MLSLAAPTTGAQDSVTATGPRHHSLLGPGTVAPDTVPAGVTHKHHSTVLVQTQLSSPGPDHPHSQLTAELNLGLVKPLPSAQPLGTTVYQVAQPEFCPRSPPPLPHHPHSEQQFHPCLPPSHTGVLSLHTWTSGLDHSLGRGGGGGCPGHCRTSGDFAILHPEDANGTSQVMTNIPDMTTCALGPRTLTQVGNSLSQLLSAQSTSGQPHLWKEGPLCSQWGWQLWHFQGRCALAPITSSPPPGSHP